MIRSLMTGLLIGSCLLACADSAQAPAGIEIVGAVMPALPPGQRVGAVYLTLKNNTDKMLVVNYLHSDLTDHIEVHRNLYSDGVMQMRQVRHLSLDPWSKIHFEPGGYHLMLSDIDSAPSVGDTFSLVFEFESGLQATTTVAVKER